MEIAGTRTKYYLLSVVALVVAFGVLALLPSPAQAQVTADKECSPNPVQVGEQITCTIDVVPTDLATPPTIVVVTDTLPDSVTVTEATQQQFVNGVLSATAPCTVSGNTVTCPPGVVEGPILRLVEQTVVVTIDAIAEQCGTFTNTAEVLDILANNTVTSTAEFTVEGCEETSGGAGGGAGGGADGEAAPITQEGEQESESGEIDQTFEVS